ncbi:hypothetical protein [Bradyrhizobium sp. ARR65]|uniref:hypothetical protein n=1 Tax=Bradyrhizobium sp. ARR65 TaxID=1040989 RepID=UPI00046691AA|nr:hypothetical protein [Bradyrhizobium sp. ARR65]
MTLICIPTANTTAYDSVRGILAMAGAELDRLGHEVQLLNIGAPDATQRLNALLPRHSETVAIGMSGIGLELYTSDHKLFWEAAQIPFFSWYCDHPSYFARRHRIQSRYVVHGYVFPDHAAFNRDFLRPDSPVFAAHIGIPDPGFFHAAAPENRNGRILFAKSGWSTAELERKFRATMPEKLARILFEALEAARGKSCGAFPEILTAVAADHLVYLTPGDTIFNALLTRLDNYTRAQRTQEVGAVLADYPVDFVGGGWSEFAESTATKTARFLGPLPFDAVRAGLGSYLGAVSLNPNTDLSMHDRVFFSLGAGTVPIFDANQFSRRHLPLLSRFSFDHDPDSLRATVETVLADPAAAQAATAATFAAIYPSFSMRRSVEEICEILTQLAGAGADRLLPAEPSPAGAWSAPQLAKAVA